MPSKNLRTHSVRTLRWLTSTQTCPLSWKLTLPVGPPAERCYSEDLTDNSG